MRVNIFVGLQLLFPNAATEEDGTGGLIIDVFDDSDRIGAGCTSFMVADKAACQNLSKAFLKSMKTW